MLVFFCSVGGRINFSDFCDILDLEKRTLELLISTLMLMLIIQFTPHWGFSVADYIKCYAYF